MKRPSVEELVRALRLEPHPEGGYFRETYRAAEKIPHAALPKRFTGERAYSTAIYNKGLASPPPRAKPVEPPPQRRTCG